MSQPSIDRIQSVRPVAAEAAALLKLDWAFTAQDAPIYGGFIGQGYGIPSQEAAEAIKLVGRTEGILLDPVYTGKTMAGFLYGLQNKYFEDHQKIVFIHTGGEPAFFAGTGDWLNAGITN